MPIPELNADGELPPGIHRATLREVEITFGQSNDRRKLLLSGLKSAAQNFKVGGVSRIYVDGSFTTEKELPDDIDGCWDAEGATEAVDSVFWDFETEDEFHDVSRPAMKAKYGLDFFIAGGCLP